MPCGHEQCHAHAQCARHDAGAACHAQGGSIAGSGAEALVKVDTVGRGHRVDVGRYGAHGSGKNSRNEQSGHPLWQLAHHEEGKYRVGLAHGVVERCGVCLEKGVQPCANGKECHTHKHAHQAVEHDAAPCASLVLSGKVALNDSLVAGVRYEVVGHTA